MKKVFFLAILVLLVVDFTFAQGCSQCKLLAEQGAELDENAFGSSINSGILYLLAIPYVLLMFLFRHRIVRFLKRNKKA